jgi:KUP system potassium uptake protein
VFLALTGGEALYADMGHFGSRPVRMAWFAAGLAGAAAELLRPGRAGARESAAGREPLLSRWRRQALPLPLVLLATAATVIASQATISGAFSVTRQAMQLDLLPRLTHPADLRTERGQIYVPAVNWLHAGGAAVRARPSAPPRRWRQPMAPRWSAP